MFSTFVRHTYSQRTLAVAAAACGLSAVTAITSTALDNGDKRPHKKIVVVGGGTAGIGVVAMLKREGLKDVTIIEPSDTHYYQPLWTLVGGGVKDVSKSARPMKDILANTKCEQWIQKKVKSFDPAKNEVTMEDGSKIHYDYLVVAAGIQIDWHKVPGLEEGLQQPDSGVVSIYHYAYAEKTWKTFQAVTMAASKGDDTKKNLIFTMSPTAIKCAGAPMKVMFLADDNLRRQNMRDTCNVKYFTPAPSMFGIAYYSEKLEAVRRDRTIDASFLHELVRIDVPNKLALFHNKATNETVQQPYDLLHVAPHMSAPDVLKQSPLVDATGYVDVHPQTLQHKKYENVFGIGDCTNTPNSKTAAAITSQAPVLVHNLTQALEGKVLDGKYNGYASCPLIIARGKTILAEFGYGGKLMETFARDTGKFPLKYFGTEGYVQQRFFYFLKESLFPYVYWNLWTRGLWYGTTGPFHPGIERMGEAEILAAAADRKK